MEARTIVEVPVGAALARLAAADLAAPAAGGSRDFVRASPMGPPEPAAAEAPGEAARQAAMRYATGALMTRSKREIPHYYLATMIDLSTALAWLDGFVTYLASGER